MHVIYYADYPIFSGVAMPNFGNRKSCTDPCRQKQKLRPCCLETSRA